MNTTDQKRTGWIEPLLVVMATGLFAVDLCLVAPSLKQGVDYVFMWKSIWHFLIEALRGGSMPLWNPHIGLGRPFLADMATGVFYPPLYLIGLGPRLGVFLLVWLHCILAVCGMRRLGATLQVGRVPVYFMSLCFLGSGALTARWATGQLPYCWALCYTPWLFNCAMRTNEPWNTRRVAVYALMLAAQFLCGNPHVFWFSTIGQAAFIVGRATGFSLQEAIVSLRRGFAQFAIAGAWCGGLVAVALLPFAELVTQGNRNAPSRAYADLLRLEWVHLGTLVSPTGLSQQAWPNWESNLFVGVIVLILGFAGLRSVREPSMRGWFAVLAVGLLIALGSNTPAFKIFYHFLPGFASLRVHARAGFLVVFALICASGMWLGRPNSGLWQKWPDTLKFRPRHLLIGLVILQTLDLLRGTWQIKNLYTYQNIFIAQPDSALQETLLKRLHDAGLMDESQPPPRVSLPDQLVPANNAMMYHYSTFDADFPLFLRRDWDYLHGVLGLPTPELINTHVSPSVYERGPLPYADLALAIGYDATNREFSIATNPSPRAFLVYAAEVDPDYYDILKRLAGGYDIHRSALIEKPLAVLLRTGTNEPAASAHIRRFQTDSIWIDVDAKENALLVLAEAWYPGWRAEIDGQIRDCVPANIWMRAVPVPAGRHEVRVYFHQNYLLPGAVISAASMLLLVFVLFGKHHKSHPEVDQSDFKAG